MPQSKEKVAPLRLPNLDPIADPGPRARAEHSVELEAHSRNHDPMRRRRRRPTLLEKVRTLFNRWVTMLIPGRSDRSQRFWNRRKKRRRGRPDGTKGAGSRSI